MHDRQTDQNFVYRLAHDLAAPIRQVNAFATLLADATEADGESPDNKYLELIQRQSKLAQMMLSALVDLNRLNQTRLDQHNFLLSTLITDLATVHPTLNVESAISTEAQVLQDQSLVMKMLGHMVDNALTYCDDPQWKLSSEVTSSGEHIDLLIQDNGPGMTVEQWEQYQAPFARYAGHADVDGLGMGLTMAVEIGHILGADLRHADVSSGFGFRLSLPLCKVPNSVTV